jgi:hypothetical protein
MVALRLLAQMLVKISKGGSAAKHPERATCLASRNFARLTFLNELE